MFLEALRFWRELVETLVLDSKRGTGRESEGAVEPRLRQKLRQKLGVAALDLGKSPSSETGGILWTWLVPAELPLPDSPPGPDALRVSYAEALLAFAVLLDAETHNLDLEHNLDEGGASCEQLARDLAPLLEHLTERLLALPCAHLGAAFAASAAVRSCNQEPFVQAAATLRLALALEHAKAAVSEQSHQLDCKRRNAVSSSMVYSCSNGLGSITGCHGNGSGSLQLHHLATVSPLALAARVHLNRSKCIGRGKVARNGEGTAAPMAAPVSASGETAHAGSVDCAQEQHRGRKRLLRESDS